MIFTKFTNYQRFLHFLPSLLLFVSDFNFQKKRIFTSVMERQYFAHTNDRVANFDGIKITPSAPELSIVRIRAMNSSLLKLLKW